MKRPWKVRSEFTKTKTFSSVELAKAEAQIQCWVYGKNKKVLYTFILFRKTFYVFSAY